MRSWERGLRRHRPHPRTRRLQRRPRRPRAVGAGRTARTKGAGQATAATTCEGLLSEAMNPAESTSCRAGNGSGHSSRPSN